MTLDEIIAGLNAHPDAKRASGDGDPARPVGLLELSVYPSGAVSVLYHWGRRSFRNAGELEGWLMAGLMPASWKE